MDICWQMCLKGIRISLWPALIGTKHQVSVIMKVGRQCRLTFNATRFNAPSYTMIPGAQITVGNTDAKQKSTPISTAWWRPHVCPHTLEKVLSGGFLIRKESPLQDHGDQLLRDKDSNNRLNPKESSDHFQPPLEL